MKIALLRVAKPTRDPTRRAPNPGRIRPRATVRLLTRCPAHEPPASSRRQGRARPSPCVPCSSRKDAYQEVWKILLALRPVEHDQATIRLPGNLDPLIATGTIDDDLPVSS